MIESNFINKILELVKLVKKRKELSRKSQTGWGSENDFTESIFQGFYKGTTSGFYKVDKYNTEKVPDLSS